MIGAEGGQESASLTLPDIAAAITLIAAIAFLAIAISGLAALASGRLFGETFVAADPAGTNYSDELCEFFRSAQPDAATCAEAATAEHFDNLVSDRVTTGIPGLILLCIYWLIRRGEARPNPRVPQFVLAAAPPCFSLAAFLLFGFGIMQLAFSGSEGTGGDFAAGVVATAVALVTAQWGAPPRAGPPASKGSRAEVGS